MMGLPPVAFRPNSICWALTLNTPTYTFPTSCRTISSKESPDPKPQPPRRPRDGVATTVPGGMRAIHWTVGLQQDIDNRISNHTAPTMRGLLPSLFTATLASWCVRLPFQPHYCSTPSSCISSPELTFFHNGELRWEPWPDVDAKTPYIATTLARKDWPEEHFKNRPKIQRLPRPWPNRTSMWPRNRTTRTKVLCLLLPRAKQPKKEVVLLQRASLHNFSKNDSPATHGAQPLYCRWKKMTLSVLKLVSRRNKTRSGQTRSGPAQSR